MIHHHGASLSKQQTTDLLFCHGTQQDLSLSTVKQNLITLTCTSSQVLTNPAIQSPARACAANVATHARTKLYTEIMN